jgi:hypothetical protein
MAERKMKRVDAGRCRSPIDVCIRVAGTVEGWPDFLPHYRWVRFHEQTEFANGTVEMAAWRIFGPLKYPTWWKSLMKYEEGTHVIHYRHIEGITAGMDVRWEFTADGDETDIVIVHEWTGPRWPLISWLAANLVIGPLFISAIAQRTLAGVSQEAERQAHA